MKEPAKAPELAPVPLLDLERIHGALREELDQAIREVTLRGDFVLGEAVTLFEKEFAEYCGARRAVAVNSGTDALHLALKAAMIGPGDEVVTTPFTFIATVEAIEMCGAQPVLCDIDQQDLTLDLDCLEKVLTPKTKAVIPVHIHGQPARMKELRKLCCEKGLFLLEDACQAHGAEDHGLRTGRLGDAAAFSFYPSKNLGGFGDGGVVVTDNDQVADRIVSLRNHGQTELGQKAYHHQTSGFCTRLDTIQAAVLRVKLRYLEQWNQQRVHTAEYYHSALAGLKAGLPLARQDSRHVYYVYALRCPHRDRLRDSLRAEGINTGVHYPFPIHLLPAAAHLGQGEGSFPQAERACRETLSIPLFPGITQEEATRVAEACSLFLG